MFYYDDNKFERCIKNIKCYQHYRQVTHVNLQQICPYGTRILCEECEKNDEVITVERLKELCLGFQDQMKKEQSPKVKQVRINYTNVLQQINDAIKVLTSKIDDALLHSVFPRAMIDEIGLIMEGPIQYGLKNFEKLAQAVSENVECFAKYYNLIEYQVSDYNIRQANEYCQIAQNLLVVMNDFLQQHNLHKDLQDIASKSSKKLIAETKQFIADVQLNFDQTIIGAKYAENVNVIKFWKVNQFDQWSIWTQVQCYKESFIKYQFSKFSNQFITCGADEKQPAIGKKYFSSIKLWSLNQDQNWILEAQIHQSQARLCYLTFNNSENLIVAGAGGTVVLLEKVGQEFKHQQNKQKSDEMITSITFNCYDNLLAVGACDQKVTIYNYNNRKLTPFQQIKLSHVPKKMLFSNVQSELYILSKDGVLNIFTQKEGEQFIQQQRIINYKGNIRALELSKDSKVLGIGGESNTIQLFQKIQHEWRCFEEILQEDFVESLTFGNYSRLVIATSNSDLYIHQKYY